MESYSHTWLLALSMALVLLTVNSLLGSRQLAHEADAARQQAAAWKTYALTAHGHGLRGVELETPAAASTRSPREPPNRFSF